MANIQKNNFNLQCSHCCNTIVGKYFKDYWGNIYHADHLNLVASCFYCGRLISERLTKGGHSYSDGSQICGLCLSTAVNDINKGKKLLHMVYKKLDSFGIKISPFKPDFYLIDRSRLKKITATKEKQGFARFEKTTKGKELKSFKMEIYILKGLPESSFISTVAHELMHIWIYSRNVTDLNPKIEEGSCNYASYLILNTIKTAESAYRINELLNDRSRIYGKGFKKIESMVHSKGITFWLKTLTE